MPRNSYPPSRVSFSFGPGPVTTTIKVLIWTNIAVFVVTLFSERLRDLLALVPAAVLTNGEIWRPLTYLFVHAGFAHIIINMLMLWMFGVELERLWGTRFFLKFYLVTGLGAAAATIFLALLPWGPGNMMWLTKTVGASGAIYGLLLAYGLYFPDRPIYLYMLFPIPAKYFVMIMGGIALLSSMSSDQGGVANIAHLGGLVVGYVYLKTWRARPLAEIKYRYFKWKMNRMRRKFDVYSGGKNDWDRRVH